jgi:hypothetical protein
MEFRVPVYGADEHDGHCSVTALKITVHHWDLGHGPLATQKQQKNWTQIFGQRPQEDTMDRQMGAIKSKIQLTVQTVYIAGGSSNTANIKTSGAGYPNFLRCKKINQFVIFNVVNCKTLARMVTPEVTP